MKGLQHRGQTGKAGALFASRDAGNAARRQTALSRANRRGMIQA